MDYTIPVALLLGMRHVLEPDHLAAITVLTVRNDPRQRGLWIGATWGIGHAVGLLIVGVVALIIGRQIPVEWRAAADVGVAVMLVALGVDVLLRTRRHLRDRPATPTLLAGRTTRPHALGVGIAHGMAGSGALLAMSATAQPGLAGLAFLTAVALGAVAGMALLSSLLAASLRRAGACRTSLMVPLRGVAAVSSAAVGMGLLWNTVALLS